MTTSVELQTEITGLKKRRDELQRELEGAKQTHEESHAALVRAGGKREIDNLTVTNSRVSALSEAINVLDSEVAGKRTALEAVLKREQETARSKRLVEIEQEKQQAEEDYFAAREGANEALAPFVDAMMEATRRMRRLTSEATALGGYTRDDFTRREQKPFGEAVDIAYTIALRTIDRDEKKARLREATERERQRELRTRAAKSLRPG